LKICHYNAKLSTGRYSKETVPDDSFLFFELHISDNILSKTRSVLLDRIYTEVSSIFAFLLQASLAGKTDRVASFACEGD
jgi:hypothetical protein